MKKFRESVRDHYQIYYRDGDEAHLIDHADAVCDLALSINQTYDERLVILASYLHDTFNATNRQMHHTLAYDHVLKSEDKFLKELSQKELLEVAHAVLEHRASFRGEYYAPLSAIISSADRGLPDLDFIVIRSMRFNKGDVQDVYDHIKDKYGSKGYAKYPEVYQAIFREELEAFHKRADALSMDGIMEIWNSSQKESA